MILCRVVGHAVSTVKHPSFEGHTVLIVQPVNERGEAINRSFLASDSVQAGVGDLVLAAREGNTARQILGSDSDPFHAVVLAIVDEVCVGDVVLTGPAGA
jgi:microcompartment protein CcmK/EutM